MPLTQIYEKFEYTLSKGVTHKTYYMSPLLEPKKPPRKSCW